MLAAMPTGHRTHWRAGPLVRVGGSIVAIAFAMLALCRCGSEFHAPPSSNASDAYADESDDDGGVVLVGSPFDDATPPVTDAGEGGSVPSEAGDGGPPGDGGCDPTKDPKDEPCLVDGAFGVFVSVTTGHDTATGTKADPLKTIGAGIAKASTGAKRVFVCAGTYNEHVVVGAAQDGIGVYGGFDCTGWKYASTNAVKVTPSTTGYALEVDLLKTGATFEDVEFDSQSATAAGASSVAVFANQSVVTFRRVVMTAGDGAAGTQGDAGVNYVGVQAASGDNADGGAGGPRVTCTCVNGDQSAGGAGGGAGPPPTAGLSGAPNLDGGKPGIGGDIGCGSGGLGHVGANASDAVAVTGATGSGGLTDHGWSSAAGNAGMTASIAQGGGGGGGNSSSQLNDAGLSVSGGGGSGGCGGCGGGGGAPGIGGGSSFALLSFRSTVGVADSQLSSHDGKSGGKGGNGQIGQTGGYAGGEAAPGCPGGIGGIGGGGGGGSGGSGGVSAAVGYTGNPPTETGTVSKTVGNFGTGGPGGSGGGANNAGGKGKDGVASAVLAL